MKKIFLTGILSLLMMGISFAQMPKIGITAGLNASSIIATGINNSKYKAGFQAGVVADFGITQNFSIVPELLFAQRGSKYEVNEPPPVGTVSTTLNYLQLPVNAAYKFDVGMGSKVFVFAGPYLGYGLSGSLKSVNGSSSIKYGSNGVFKYFDFGIDIGVGYLYEKVFFKLQWNPGLININNPELMHVDNYNENNYSVKNMNIAATIGYYFN